MTARIALLALSLAALAWLLRRPSEGASRPEQPEWDEPEDGVQPADPMTLALRELRAATAHLSDEEVDESIATAIREYRDTASSNTTDYAYDPTYLEAQAVAVRRGTQSGPLGPSA